MKIVVASDSYKGCLTSKQCADIIERAALKVDSTMEVKKYMVGDGGEGTMDAFVECTNGEYVKCNVYDAYHKEISCVYGRIHKTTAIIEVGKVIGLNMYAKEERRVMYASSYGVGQLVAHAIKHGCKKIILALGGSCSNDGGMGMLIALGMRFYDKEGNRLIGIPYNLEKIDHIDTSRLLDFSKIECIAACDVKNTLLGEKGATYTYGRQKGLYPNQMDRVEKGMVHYAEKMKEVGFDLTSCIGGGAAGGIGAAFIGVLNAQVQSGINLLFSYNHIEKDIQDCDLVITGEGQSDKQTLYGKVPVGVLNVAKKYNKPCICISGALGLEYNKLYELGFVGIYSIADRAMSFSAALSCAEEKLEAASYTILKTIHYFLNKEDL